MNKLTLVIVLTALSFIGFMLKIPGPLQPYGFKLHAAFYFFASIFLLGIFPKWHFLILIGLIFFGIAIEKFQSLSNSFFDRRIHGNFDPEDIKYNLYGIFLSFIPFYGFKILGKIFS